MIEIVKGDLFSTDFEVIAHGCNCAGGFGAGVAKVIANKYPHVRKEYLKKFYSVGWKPGDVQLVSLNEKQSIANCGTQKHYLPRNKDLFEYEAFETVCRQLRDHCLKNNLRLALPKIGAGLAGGNWDRILAIMEKELEGVTVRVYEL